MKSHLTRSGGARLLLGFLLYSFSCNSSLGAGPALDWARLIPNVCGVAGDAVAEDSNGDIYVGSGPRTALTKFNSAGNLVWTWGRVGDDCANHIWVHGISIDASNDIYLAGFVSGTFTNGNFQFTSPLNFSRQATFFAKLRPDGTAVFAKFATNLYGDDKPLIRTAAGEFLTGGYFQDNPFTYEGTTLSPTANGDLAVLKLQQNGSLIWARRGSGGGSDVLQGLASNPDGDVFVATYTIAPQPASFGMGGVVSPIMSGKTLYLVKMDAAGNGNWIKGVASSFDPTVSEPQASALASSARDGTVVWAGEFAGSLNIVSPAVPSIGRKDIFVAKVTSAGTVLWAKTFGGTNDQRASALAVDAQGSIYLGGFFSEQISIGANHFTSRGNEDAFVAKLGDDGTVVWAKHIGYSGADRVNGLSFTRRGELLVVGVAEGGLFVDGAFFETSGADGFIAKFRVDGLPPVFITQPQSQVVSAGMTINLGVEVASSIQPVSYQWWFNGVPLNGQTNSSLTLSNVQPTQGGSYFVVVDNQAGSVQSDAAVLTYTDASTLVLSVHPSLRIYGTPGRTYRIEYATETRTPAQWTGITNITLETTPHLWIDQEAATGSKRFYRVLLQPGP